MGDRIPTVLLLGDGTVDRNTIAQVLGHDCRLLTARDVEEFLSLVDSTQRLDVAIIALDMVSDENAQRIGQLLGPSREAKVVALAPVHQGSGLTTLLKAESLHARHLLATPLDPPQLAVVLNAMSPAVAPQN